MIQQEDVAAEISKLMIDFGAKLDQSVALVQERCSAAEFKAYRTAVGNIMGGMLLDVMNPLYAMHPHLKPKELR